MKNSQKGFAHIMLFLIIGLLVLGGGVYYLNSKSHFLTAPNEDSQIGAAVTTTTTPTVTVSSCQDITKPGNYVLTKSLATTTLSKACIDIHNVQGVTLNCNNYS